MIDVIGLHLSCSLTWGVNFNMCCELLMAGCHCLSASFHLKWFGNWIRRSVKLHKLTSSSNCSRHKVTFLDFVRLRVKGMVTDTDNSAENDRRSMDARVDLFANVRCWTARHETQWGQLENGRGLGMGQWWKPRMLTARQKVGCKPPTSAFNTNVLGCKPALSPGEAICQFQG